MFGRRQKDVQGSVTLSPRLVEIIRNEVGAPVAYDELYKRNASVRTVIDMLSLHFAQVGLKMYERVSDLDRRHDTTSPGAVLLAEPNVDTPPARFFRATAVSYFTFGNAYWGIFEANGRTQLLLMPPAGVKIEGGGLLLGDTYTFYPLGNAEGIELPRDRVVHFMDDPDPMEPRLGVSRLAALRSDLVEQAAVSKHMTAFWENAAQIGNVIERPLAAPDWSDDARKRFETSWRNRFSGPDNAGKTGVLEEGMTLKELSAFSAQAQQVLESRVFSLEAVARAFGVPIAVLGLGDQASYASQKEFHQALYQDTLGPHFRVFEDEINLQLLPRFAGSGSRYVEFNIAEKLQGAFEDQVGALATAVGGPWMSPDEARARVNLPQKGGAADDLQTTPGAGSLAEPTVAAAPVKSVTTADFGPFETKTPPWRIEERDGKYCVVAVETGETVDCHPTRKEAEAHMAALYANVPDARYAVEPKAVPGGVIRLRRGQRREYEAALREFFNRQAASVLSKLGAKAAVDSAFDTERWDRELADVLVTQNRKIAHGAGRRAAAQLGGEFDTTQVANYLSDHAEKEARMVNATTLTELSGEDADAAAVFEKAAGTRAAEAAVGAVTRYNAFGRTEGATQNGAKSKTWIVTSANSRHPELDGEKARIGGVFSNGGAYPGDPDLDTEETAHCECLVDFG